MSRKINGERFLVLASWFFVLICVRLGLGMGLQNQWFGTLGSVGITFAVFYLILRFTPLKKFGTQTDRVLSSWYRKKVFYLSGLVCIALLSSILVVTEYGYSRYSDKLVIIQMNEQEISKSFEMLSTDLPLQQQLHKNLARFSPLEVMAITLASTDASLHGYYSKIISFVLAENLEIMVFMFVFRSRKSIFATPALLTSFQKAAHTGK